MSFWTWVLVILYIMLLFLAWWGSSFMTKARIKPWGSVPMLHVTSGRWVNVVPGIVKDGKDEEHKIVIEKKGFFGSGSDLPLRGDVKWIRNSDGRVVGALSPADKVYAEFHEDIGLLMKQRDRLSSEVKSYKAKLEQIERRSKSERDDEVLRHVRMVLNSKDKGVKK